MKIGIDCRLWNETGVGRYIRNIVYQLARSNAQDEFVLFMLDKDITDLQLPSNFRVVTVNIRWHTIKEQLLLPIIFLKEKLDLLHVPYFNVPVFYPGKIVTTIHDLTLLRVKTGRATTKSYLAYMIWRLAFKVVLFAAVTKSKFIFVVSNYVKHDLHKVFRVSLDNIIVTPNAVDSKFVPATSVQSLSKYGISKPYIFYVGNAHPHKNLENLVKAFEKVSLKHRDLQLILAGRKDYFFERLENEVILLPYASNIKFVGFIDDADLPSLYSNSEAFVNPSMHEGFGIQLIEAFACGTKVVCSNVTSLPEVGENVAYYFDPINVDNMSDVILTALESDYSSRRIKGFEIVKKYSWEISANTIYKTYKLCV